MPYLHISHGISMEYFFCGRLWPRPALNAKSTTYLCGNVANARITYISLHSVENILNVFDYKITYYKCFIYHFHKILLRMCLSVFECMKPRVDEFDCGRSMNLGQLLSE